MTGAAVLLAYLFGSVPTGLWLGQLARGVDIREHGSQNIGATNTLRVLGKVLGSLALLGDAGKGAIAVLLIARLGDWEYARHVCGIAAIIGHLAPIYLKFKGGKGVATSAGVFLALCPESMGIAILLFLLGVGLTRMVSVGSIAAAAALGVSVFFFPYGVVTQGMAVLVAVLVIVKHRSNILRIIQGKENRF
jgi:glycerol-3-phosphate acyltransferase PlsY